MAVFAYSEEFIATLKRLLPDKPDLHLGADTHDVCLGIWLKPEVSQAVSKLTPSYMLKLVKQGEEGVKALTEDIQRAVDLQELWSQWEKAERSINDV